MAIKDEKYCKKCKRETAEEINKAYWNTYPLFEKMILENKEVKTA